MPVYTAWPKYGRGMVCTGYARADSSFTMGSGLWGACTIHGVMHAGVSRVCVYPPPPGADTRAHIAR